MQSWIIKPSCIVLSPTLVSLLHLANNRLQCFDVSKRLFLNMMQSGSRSSKRDAECCATAWCHQMPWRLLLSSHEPLDQTQLDALELQWGWGIRHLPSLTARVGSLTCSYGLNARCAGLDSTMMWQIWHLHYWKDFQQTKLMLHCVNRRNLLRWSQYQFHAGDGSSMVS